MKTCHVCLKTKHEENFYHNITSADGWANMCKLCCRKYSKYKREQYKLQPKPRKLRQKIFYNSKIPLPPNPDHQITIQKTEITLHFD